MGTQPREERTLLEAIRQGKAPTVVKRQAARGTLPVAAGEMLEILTFLTADPDPTCSDTARQTLAGWHAEKLAATLAEPETSAAALAYFSRQDNLAEALVAAIAGHPNASDEALAALAPRLSPEQLERLTSAEERLREQPQFVEALLARPDLPADLRGRLEPLHAENVKEQEELAAALAREEEAEATAKPEEKLQRMSVTQKISKMSVADRIQLALKGNKDERMVLVRDPSKVVFRAVLQSPKLSDQEVENFATMKNVSDEVLRLIAGSRQYVKNYIVVRNLLNNPRTPIDVSLGLLNRLTERDLKFLTMNRNVPETVRTMAFRLHKQRSSRH